MDVSRCFQTPMAPMTGQVRINDGGLEATRKSRPAQATEFEPFARPKGPSALQSELFLRTFCRFQALTQEWLLLRGVRWWWTAGKASLEVDQGYAAKISSIRACDVRDGAQAAGRGRWQWQVCDRTGKAIMQGFEDSRPAAKYRGERALFQLLLTASRVSSAP